MPRTLRIAAIVSFLVVCASSSLAADRSGKYPGWLAPDEATPFFPDDAFSIAPNEQVTGAYLRKSFHLPYAPRRAVIAVTGPGMISVRVNGELVMEVLNYGVSSLPRFTEVTRHLESGANVLELCAQRTTLAFVYAQLRMEREDGSFEDIVTDDSWQWHHAGGEGWRRREAPEEDWMPVSVRDNYYGTQGEGRFKEFALMPRETLRERMKAYNDRLRASWPIDRLFLKPTFEGAYTRPECAAQYAGFLRIDPKTGQVVDATGKIRHLFFTVYNNVSMYLWNFDFDRVEEDLALMEKSGIHPYLRNIGWAKLLDADGNWQRCEIQPEGSKLPEFKYNYEVLDYFLDRCQAHGRFVVIEGDFYWTAHGDTLPAPYRSRYYLYPEVVEANALAHRKMLVRYSQCAIVAGYMIGEEEISMSEDLENGHLAQAFSDYLRDRYGSLDTLKRTWRAGYDFDDPSKLQKDRRKTDWWGGGAHFTEEVDYPYYPLKEGLWDAASDWSEVGLPVWPQYKSVHPPHAELLSHRSYNEFTPLDPVWIDYNAFREDVLYLDFVSRWARIVREGVPDQWLFHCNAQDFTSHWHFPHFFRRAELPFDVIGTGSHDDGGDLSEIWPYARMRKYLTIIASYRPYALAQAGPAIGIASGEGAGGKRGDEDGILNYYRAQSFEMVGHGAAFELSYWWGNLSCMGAGAEGRAKFTKALEWMGGFYEAVDGVSFSLARDVDVLVVRNNNLQRSNRGGRDYGNAAGLADFLGQLNVEFDIVMDLDLVYGRVDRKIGLGKYRMVFLPCIDCDYGDDFWGALDAWLSDPAYRGKRSVVVGYVGNRTPYLWPTGRFHPTLAKWLGATDYAATVRLEKRNTLDWRPLGGEGEAAKITIDLSDRDISDTGVFESGQPILLTSDGKAVATATVYEGNRVFAFGFPLGMVFDLIWGMTERQEPYDAVATVYDDLLNAVGIDRPIRAPHNVRVAVSDDKSVILVKERFGIATTDLCTLNLPAGARYKGCELLPQEDGRTLIRANLAPYGGLYFKRVE